MTDFLPEDILSAVKLLDSSFGSRESREQVKLFKSAVYLLNDSMDDLPIYREDISKIKYSYTVRLLCSLAPNPDYDTWLEYVLLLCIDLKNEVKSLKNNDAQLFESFLTFLRLYASDTPDTFRQNIARFIDEIIQ